MEKLLGKSVYDRLFAYKNLTEIRIGKNRYIFIKSNNHVIKTDVFCDETYLERTFLTAVRNSRYSFEEELSKGFIPYENGVRIGVAGKGKVIKDKCVFTEIESLIVRIPHEILGASSRLSFLYGDFDNTLIVSPPSCGKTTLLRDLVKNLSTRYDVVLIDERYEVSGGGLNVGERTVVVGGIPKDKCYENIVRSLAPEIVAVDEIMGENDRFALKKLLYAGIKLLATVHGDNIESIKKSSLSEVFSHYVLLSSIPSVGCIKSIE